MYSVKLLGPLGQHSPIKNRRASVLSALPSIAGGPEKFVLFFITWEGDVCIQGEKDISHFSFFICMDSNMLKSFKPLNVKLIICSIFIYTYVFFLSQFSQKILYLFSK